MKVPKILVDEQGHSLRVFEEEWLNKCYKKALVFDNHLKVRMGKSLADELIPELDSIEKQAVLFDLLGLEFVVPNFPRHEPEPMPVKDIEPWKRKQMERELKASIYEKAQVVLNKEKHHEEEDLFRVKRNIYNIFNRGMEDAHERSDKDKDEFVTDSLLDVIESSSCTHDVFIKKLRSNGVFIRPQLRPLVFKIMIKSPIEFDHFKAGLKSKLKDRRYRSIQDWPTKKAMMTLCLDLYQKSPHLKAMFSDPNFLPTFEDFDDRCMHVIKILVTCAFWREKVAFFKSPRAFFWLALLIPYFPDIDKFDVSADERVLLGAYHFSTFATTADFITEEAKLEQLTKAVDKAFRRTDREFYQQLIGTLRKVELRSYKFIDKLDSNEGITFTGGVEPIIKEWLSTGFVGCLSNHGMSLALDTLVLNNFDRSKCIGICAGILHLIKPELKRVINSVPKIFNTLTKGPRKIYLGDFRSMIKQIVGSENDDNQMDFIYDVSDREDSDMET